MDGCILCYQPIVPDDKNSFSKLTKKGLDSCNKVRILHGQPQLEFDENSVLYVHLSCRKRCVNSKYIATLEKKMKDEASSSVSITSKSHPSENVRSRTKSFNVKSDCILCGDYVDIINAKKHPNRTNLQFSRVEKLSFCENLREKCIERKCSWSENIISRINLVFGDFVAEEVTYHISDYKFERKKQVKTLASVQYIQHEGEEVIIDPQILFQRLVMVGERSMDLDNMFSYELCSYLASLFDKHVLIRSAQKGDLIRALVDLTSGNCVLKPQDIDPGHSFVLDGGNLLHQVQWKKGSLTYSTLLDIYVSFVSQHSSATVIFDGYPECLTKDECHLKRKSDKVSVTIMIGPEKIVDVHQKSFLDNELNKQRFINLLANALKISGVTVLISDADADVQIVDVALEKARIKPTVVIGNDSDLIVLLLHKFNVETMEDIIVHSKQRIISIKTLKLDLSEKFPRLTETLLFAHAISGCNTCSSPLGIGKKGLVSKIHKLQEKAIVFMNRNEAKERLISAGEEAMCLLYGIKHDNLDQGRAERYRERVSTNTKALEIQQLPPTSNACQQHSLRVYLQVQEWLGNIFPPTEYGWEERICATNGKRSLRPMRMTKAAAPSELLKIIRCGCTQNICTNNRCSCYESTLKCSTACRNCKGTLS